MSRGKRKNVFPFLWKLVCFVSDLLSLMKHPAPKPLFIIILSLFILTLSVYAASTKLSWVFGEPHTFGLFSPSGNAGNVTLMTDTQISAVGGPGVTIEGDGTNSYLVGNMFLQTVWWVELWVSGYPVRVTPPAGASDNLMLPWAVDGYAWSPNAGWITLQSLDSNMYSGVYYVPGSGSLDGYAWSDSLGYIHFASSSGTSDAGLVARVKIIGNTAWASTFDSLFVANNGVMKTTSILTPFINNIRKNVALLTRNAPDNVINTLATTQKSLWNILYYRLSGWSVSLSTINTFCAVADGPRSIIVEWADIVIDRDVVGAPGAAARSCAIITISNGTTGWNVYLTNIPLNIKSYIIAEGSVFAGTSAAALYNDTKEELTNLPQRQLYILGGIISRNTIGWAITDAVARGACPFTESTCDRNTAIKYDLNFARNYNKTPANRAYTKNNTLENFSLIIEYDSRIVGDAPPGMKNE